MKIMSNEMLVAAYRDALNNGDDKTWIETLKLEVKKRGLSPKNEK
ncbi:acyl-CoA synthetase [Domibacillus antri]|uniref:Acyl-CoA synthetase n=1 Tax=Domibacillus antri TaxID=1714264 RepID=A0A1Q8Q5C0_9BACI|nr:sporulation histidine kinase inhibitor Sda [Domibacillus antri]OLN22485.1 acyl-CoA synthetase [Domibacillus antri]